MAHFARLENNIVIEVRVVANAVLQDENGDEQESLGSDFLVSLHGPAVWKQTSYNGTFRKNYAGIGYIYDESKDAFMTEAPYASWVLNSHCRWEAPSSKPSDGKTYSWNEVTTSWDEFVYS